MPAGRPSTYTPEIAEAICYRLIEGESLRAICRGDGMPDRNTVYNWMEAHQDFAAKCARARELQSEHYVDRMEEVADKVETGILEPRAGSVVLSALQWRASKLAPKRYGDRLEMEHKGGVTLSVAKSDESLT